MLSNVMLFEKIYDGEPILTVISNSGEDVKYRVWCEKCVVALHYAFTVKQLLISNDINRVHWAVLGLSQDRVCSAAQILLKLSARTA